MAHLGVFCPPATGHIDPVGALGRELQSRGHRVTAFQIPDLEAKIRAEELGYAPIGQTAFPVGSQARYLEELGKRDGLSGVRYSIECGRQLAEMICRDAPAAVRAANVDLLLVDQNEPAGGTVAEHLKIPFMTLCTSLPINREPLIPPPFTAWSYGTAWWRRLRNGAATLMVDRLIAPIQDTLNRYRRQWGLRDLRGPNDSFSTLGQIAQMTEDMDFPRREKAPTFHYVGPFCEKDRQAISFPFERLNGKPLIYASLGTLQNRQAALFRVIADACAPLDVQLVLTLGNKTMTLNDAPGDPIIVPYAPQLELLSRAHAVITHAGTNTAMSAFRFGLPMVAVPITNDQPGTAARIAYTGAGILLPLSRLTAETLRSALARILSEPSFRRNALRVQRSIQQAGGVRKAADLIEQALPKGRSHV